MNQLTFPGMPPATGTMPYAPQPHPSYTEGLNFGSPGAGAPAPAPMMQPMSAPVTAGQAGMATPTAMAPVTGQMMPAGNPVGGMNQGFFGKMGGLRGLSDIAGGIGALGNVWAAFQANKIAKESLAFQKGAYEQNLAGQIGAFNTALSDRANARYAQQGGTQAEANAYIEANKMKKV